MFCGSSESFIDEVIRWFLRLLAAPAKAGERSFDLQAHYVIFRQGTIVTVSDSDAEFEGYESCGDPPEKYLPSERLRREVRKNNEHAWNAQKHLSKPVRQAYAKLNARIWS